MPPNTLLSSTTESDIQLLKDVPLYNDVMLPATSEKLALPLSPLPPSEPLGVDVTAVNGKSDNYVGPASKSTTSNSTAEVKPI